MDNNNSIMTIGELLRNHGGEIKTGPFGTKLKAAEYTATGVPVISVGEIQPGRIVVHAKTPRVDTSVTDRMPEYLLKSGDIVFARKGSVERSAVVSSHQDGWFLGSDGIRLRLPAGCNARFFGYQISSPPTQSWLVQHATGSTMASLNQGIIERIPCWVPERATQDRIADILGTLDDKIELNRRMNETLEVMARRLFRSWFVDFDPVHAKAALRREHPKLSNADLSRRALPNMAPEIAELFPDSFEDSTFGLIPKGWTIGRLCEHTEAQKGLSYKGSGLSDTGLPLHNLNSVLEGGGYKFEGIKFYTGEFKDRHIIRPGEVIVANTEQGHDCLLLGYSAIVPHSFGNEGLFSHHIFRLRIRPESSLQPDFLCRLLNSQRMHDLVSGYGNGTTVNMLPIDGVEQPQFVVPPKELILAFDALAANVRAREIRFVDENLRLAKIRDLLLPRLLSGELLP